MSDVSMSDVSMSDVSMSDVSMSPRAQHGISELRVVRSMPAQATTNGPLSRRARIGLGQSSLVRWDGENSYRQRYDAMALVWFFSPMCACVAGAAPVSRKCSVGARGRRAARTAAVDQHKRGRYILSHGWHV